MTSWKIKKEFFVILRRSLLKLNLLSLITPWKVNNGVLVRFNHSSWEIKQAFFFRFHHTIFPCNHKQFLILLFKIFSIFIFLTSKKLLFSIQNLYSLINLGLLICLIYTWLIFFHNDYSFLKHFLTIY